MDFEVYSFRNASAILESRPEWSDLRTAITGISRQDVIATQEQIATRKKRPRGAQQAMNSIFKSRLPDPPWNHERKLFQEGESDRRGPIAKWAMDFVARGNAPPGADERDFGLGVEVSFNHYEAMAWTLVRLDIASERYVQESARIDVGVAIYPSTDLKSWGNMDSSVGTFDQACRWIQIMRPVIPLPLAIVGLFPRDLSGEQWPSTSAFPGTGKGTRS